MKFIVDAQLPRRLSWELKSWGHDSIHTLDLPAANLTSDSAITEIADREKRIVVTKDSDFVDSFLLHGEPARLLLISTGNIPNHELVHLLRTNWSQITSMFGQGDFVELSRDSLTLHQ